MHLADIADPLGQRDGRERDDFVAIGPGRPRGVGESRRVVGGAVRVQGSGFRVQGAGCRVQGAGLRGQGAPDTLGVLLDRDVDQVGVEQAPAWTRGSTRRVSALISQNVFIN